MDTHYLNLTNGLEFLPEMRERGVIPKIIRIPSTTLERNNWSAFFRCVSDEMLFDLASGNSVYFYDCGCRRKYSKTVFFAVPVIKYAIERIWFGTDDDLLPLTVLRLKKVKHSPSLEDCRKIYQEAFEFSAGKDVELLGELKSKYSYFKRYLHERQREVFLYGVSMTTEEDGNYLHFNNIVQGSV